MTDSSCSLPKTPNLNYRYFNRYFAMRHGQSEANVAGIIVSDPAVGCNNYGLSNMGRLQASDATNNAIDRAELNKNVHIITSDFLRAKETAEIVQSIIHSPHGIQCSTLLRERFFGSLNGCPDSEYQKVWALDQNNADHHEYGVESANQVVARVTGLINTLENSLSRQDILLVAHGDVLQLLQTWFQAVPATKHRELPHLNTAEIRCLNPGP